MSKKYLIVVDMQNDFVSGSLGTKEAADILPFVVQKVREFEGNVCFTLDTHEADYMQTDGWQLAGGLQEIQKAKQYPVYQKNTFGSVELAEELQKKHQTDGIESIELIGLCTDICVVSNALLLKAYMPEVPIYVDASCCAGVTPESHQAALRTMESCQILINSHEGNDV